MPLLNEASNVYLGAQSVSAVYQGDVKVWPTGNNYAWFRDFDDGVTEGWTCGTSEGEYSDIVVENGILRVTYTTSNMIYTTGPFIQVDPNSLSGRALFGYRCKIECDAYPPGDELLLGEGQMMGFTCYSMYDEASLPAGTLTGSLIRNYEWADAVVVGEYTYIEDIRLAAGIYPQIHTLIKDNEVRIYIDSCGLYDYDEAVNNGLMVPLTIVPQRRSAR